MLKKDAERFVLEMERRAALGALYQAPAETFEGFLVGWLERYGQRVRASTALRVRKVLRHLLVFGPLTLDAIRPADVEDHVAAIARRAPRQAELALLILKQVLANAKERGHTVDEAIFRLKAPRHEPREMRFLTWAEVEGLAAATVEPYEPRSARRSHGPSTGRAVRVARPERRPRWGDPERRVRRLRRRARLAQDQGCTAQGRPLREGSGACAAPAVRAVAQPARPRLPFAGRADSQRRQLPPPDLRAGCAPQRARPGALPRPPPHLRRAHGGRGAHPKYLQAQMGHSSIRVTLDLYGHLYPDANRSVLAELDRLVEREPPDASITL